MKKADITLSVFYNGQFFTALFERNDETGYTVSQTVFPVCPSDAEIYQFINDGYYSLAFSKPIEGETRIAMPAKNPKRRQREAANASKNISASTKAQTALKLQREDSKAQSRSDNVINKKLVTDRKYELRAAKRKQKHKGR